MDPIVMAYLFALAYLIIFSRGANRYNRDMEKINRLQNVLKHPDVKKELVERDFAVIIRKIKKRQKAIYIAFAVLTVIYYMVTLMYGLRGIYLSIPTIMLVGFILLILFFYSFKGGRVFPDIMLESSDYLIG